MKHLATMLFVYFIMGFSVIAHCDIDYPGCTNPLALNYDSEATEDNGTCVYSVGPDLIIIDVVTINSYCNSFNYPMYTWEITVTNIGTEDVEYFCFDDFLSNTYSCYDGSINPSVIIQPGDTSTFTGSWQIVGGWNSGQSNYMSIESIPGEIVTGNNNFVFQMPNSLDCEDDPSEEEPCDTIYLTETEYLIDTLYLTEFLIDTVYITETEYLTDTLYITEYITDTLFIDNYIYLTDTITEYIVQEVWIDCETGLPCVEVPPGLDCPDWTTIHAPNVFTPNNDGINDAWKLIYDLNCWEDVEFWVYNRWGEEVYHAYGESFDSYPYWDGSINGGNYYVSDGVYTYIFRGKKIGQSEIISMTGHISILR